MAYGFEYTHAGTLAKYLDCVQALTDEAPMGIEKDRLYFQLMDASHVSMITLTLPVKTEGIEKGEIVTINFPDIWSIFKEASDERFSLSCDGKETTWTLRSRKGMMDVTRKITVPIIDPLDDYVPDPEIPLKNEVVVPTATLLKELSEFEPYPHITLFIEDGDTLVLYSEFDVSAGKGVKRNLIKCRSGESPAFKVINHEDNSVTTYTTDFLLSYIKPLAELFPSITLGWSAEMPIHITGGGGGEGTVRYLVAPCIGMTPTRNAKKKAKK